MMQQMARGGSMGGGLPGMPGMGGLPGMPGVGKRTGARQSPQASKKKGKRVSGNPAKRAAEAAGKTVNDGAAAFELPKELRDLL
jgi:signal recognition particle subunit SRP54